MSQGFEACHLVVDTPVAWGEMDAFGHVNNAVYFRYFETARIAYFDRVSINESMAKTGLGPILASTQCQFKAPLKYPDNIQIATRVSELGEDRFTMLYYLKSINTGRVVAQGEGLIVFYDYNNNCKHALPAHIKAQIIALDAPAQR